MKRRISILLVLALVLSLGAVAASGRNAQAAKKTKLSKTKVTMEIGDAKQLKLKNAKGKVTWSSKKTSVATVTKKGKVKAKSAGQTTIIAKNKGKKYKCRVIVLEPEEDDEDWEDDDDWEDPTPSPTVTPTPTPDQDDEDWDEDDDDWDKDDDDWEDPTPTPKANSVSENRHAVSDYIKKHGKYSVSRGKYELEIDIPMEDSTKAIATFSTDGTTISFGASIIVGDYSTSLISGGTLYFDIEKDDPMQLFLTIAYSYNTEIGKSSLVSFTDLSKIGEKNNLSWTVDSNDLSEYISVSKLKETANICINCAYTAGKLLLKRMGTGLTMKDLGFKE